jgi:hypothetical protein
MRPDVNRLPLILQAGKIFRADPLFDRRKSRVIACRRISAEAVHITVSAATTQ